LIRRAQDEVLFEHKESVSIGHEPMVASLQADCHEILSCDIIFKWEVFEVGLESREGFILFEEIQPFI
jgi:hypothetical protein